MLCTNQSEHVQMYLENGIRFQFRLVKKKKDYLQDFLRLFKWRTPNVFLTWLAVFIIVRLIACF